MVLFFQEYQSLGQDEVPRGGPKGPVRQPDASLHAESFDDRALCVEAGNFIPQFVSKALRFRLPKPGSENIYLLLCP